MSSSDPGLVDLAVVTDDPAAEVFLVNSRFERIEKAVGRLEARVPPGFYKARIRVGAAMTDHLFEVREGETHRQTETVAAPALVSAAPIPQGPSSHEFQEEMWRRADDGRIHVSAGSGGSLLLLTRDPDVGTKKSGHVPWSGVELADVSGRILFKASEAGEHDEAGGTGAVTAELDPATYILRVQTVVDGIMESPVVVSPGWRTHIALASRSMRRGSVEGGGRTARRANPLDASLFLARPGQVAHSWHEATRQARLADVARQALAQQRDRVSVPVLNEILNSKWENPAAALLGAHLLMRTASEHRALLDTVIRNLSGIIPGHPDLDALRLGLATADGPEAIAALGLTFANPPSLVSSWQMVLGAAAVVPGIVPAGSLSSIVARRIVAGEPWLAWRWRRQPEADLEDEVAVATLGAALKAVAQPPARRRKAAEPELTPFETNLVRVVRDAGADRPEEELVAYAARQMAVPPATLARVTKRLLP